MPHYTLVSTTGEHTIFDDRDATDMAETLQKQGFIKAFRVEKPDDFAKELGSSIFFLKDIQRIDQAFEEAPSED